MVVLSFGTMLGVFLFFFFFVLFCFVFVFVVVVVVESCLSDTGQWRLMPGNGCAFSSGRPFMWGLSHSNQGLGFAVALEFPC